MSASAVDGVVEISQVRALAGGLTVGDAPGFPVTISVSGSYRLTSNLDVTGQPSPENVIAVDITVGSVSLDLNGFSIRRLCFQQATLRRIHCRQVVVNACITSDLTGEFIVHHFDGL